MAELTTEKRKHLPKREFAGPGRSYPIPDREHAVIAKVYAEKEEHAGKLSPSAEQHIVAKANHFLKEHKS